MTGKVHRTKRRYKVQNSSRIKMIPIHQHTTGQGQRHTHHGMRNRFPIHPTIRKSIQRDGNQGNRKPTKRHQRNRDTKKDIRHLHPGGQRRTSRRKHQQDSIHGTAPIRREKRTQLMQRRERRNKARKAQHASYPKENNKSEATAEDRQEMRQPRYDREDQRDTSNRCP